MDSSTTERVIDLRPYMNTSPTPVPETFSLERAYRMFAQLGLRHLIVMDHHNHVKGMITRKVWPMCPVQSSFMWGRMWTSQMGMSPLPLTQLPAVDVPRGAQESFPLQRIFAWALSISLMQGGTPGSEDWRAPFRWLPEYLANCGSAFT